MDDELTSLTISRAWEKVRAADDGMLSADEPARLRGFIASEHENAAASARLASRVTLPQMRSALRRMSLDSSRREKLLQAEYYILTGDTFAAPAPACECVPPLPALRAMRARADESAASYRAAAYSAGPPLADTYARFAAEESGRAAALRQMIHSLFR